MKGIKKGREEVKDAHTKETISFEFQRSSVLVNV
jgi:hypothetical protein